MPCFNPGPDLQESVASVLAQPDCLELVLADGGSTDGSLAWLQEFASREPRLRLASEPDQGPADALQKALGRARGTLIGWLNADDHYTPGALARAVDSLQQHPNWLMVYGEGEEFNPSTGLCQRYPTLPPQVGLPGFRSHCFICLPTVVFRRSMAVLLGGFDRHWRTAFDFDLWLRAFAAFPDRIGFIPHRQARTRLHPATITPRQRHWVTLEATALLARHFGSAPPSGCTTMPWNCSSAWHLCPPVSASATTSTASPPPLRHGWSPLSWLGFAAIGCWIPSRHRP